MLDEGIGWAGDAAIAARQGVSPSCGMGRKRGREGEETKGPHELTQSHQRAQSAINGGCEGLQELELFWIIRLLFLFIFIFSHF